MTATRPEHPASPVAGSAAPPSPLVGAAPSGPSRSTLPPGAGGPDTKPPAPAVPPVAGAGTDTGPGCPQVAATGQSPGAAPLGKATAVPGITGGGTGAGEQVEEARAATARRGTGRGARGDGEQEAAQPEDGTDRATAGDAARTWTIEFPAGLELLSLNHRMHWREKNRITQVIKDAAIQMARHAKVPRLERAFIVVEYQPPDKRHRDADNPIASAKPAIDGIVQAGCLIDDECPRYVVGVYCTIGQQYPRGRLVLHITEAEPLAGAA